MAINPPDPQPRIFIRLREDEYQKYNAATNRDLLTELSKTRIEDGYSLRRSDRKEVHVYILGHDPNQRHSPNRDRRQSRRASSHICTQTSDPRFTVGLEYRANVGAGCSCQSTGAQHHPSLPAFLCILSGKRQLHARRASIERPGG
jgi:hypothetical protein